MTRSRSRTTRASLLAFVSLFSSLATACTRGPGANTRQSCSPYAHLETGFTGAGTRQLSVDLDCNGIQDSVVVDRASDSLASGLPRLVVSLNGRSRFLELHSDGLPRIVDIGDLDADGVADVLLATADESVSIWPTVVLVRSDTPAVARGASAMGVYTFDPIENPDCDYRSLLPTMQRASDGKLLVSWVDVSGPAGSSTACLDPQRKQWEVVADSLRQRD